MNYQCEDAWEEPIELVCNHNLKSFPDEIMGNWLNDISEDISKEYNVPKDMPIMTGITVLSTLFMRKFEFFSDSRIPTNYDLNTYIFKIAESGARKTPVYQAIMEPLLDIERKLSEMNGKKRAKILRDIDLLNGEKDFLKRRITNAYSREKEQQEELQKKNRSRYDEIDSIIMDLQKNIPRTKLFISGDITMEDVPRQLLENEMTLAITSDEGASFLNNAKGLFGRKSNIDLILQAFDKGSKVNINRKSAESYDLDDPRLTIGLFIQPVVLKDLVSFNNRGFNSRFLFSYNISKLSTKFGDKISKKTAEKYHQYIWSLYLGLNNIKDYPIHIDSNAINIIEEQFRIIEKKKMDFTLSSEFQSWYGKLLTNLMKVMIIFSLSKEPEFLLKATNEGKKIILYEKDFKGIERLSNYFESHAKRVFSEIIIDENYLISDVWRLMEKIRNNLIEGSNRVNHRTIQQKSRTVNVNELRKMYRYLEELNFIKVIKDEGKEWIYLNPKLKKDHLHFFLASGGY